MAATLPDPLLLLLLAAALELALALLLSGFLGPGISLLDNSGLNLTVVLVVKSMRSANLLSQSRMPQL